MTRSLHGVPENRPTVKNDFIHQTFGREQPF
jgi:hypothetical protein